MLAFSSTKFNILASAPITVTTCGVVHSCQPVCYTKFTLKSNHLVALYKRERLSIFFTIFMHIHVYILYIFFNIHIFTKLSDDCCRHFTSFQRILWIWNKNIFRFFSSSSLAFFFTRQLNPSHSNQRNRIDGEGQQPYTPPPNKNKSSSLKLCSSKDEICNAKIIQSSTFT